MEKQKLTSEMTGTILLNAIDKHLAEGNELQAAADEMGISLKALKSRISRAKMSLKEKNLDKTVLARKFSSKYWKSLKNESSISGMELVRIWDVARSEGKQAVEVATWLGLSKRAFETRVARARKGEGHPTPQMTNEAFLALWAQAEQRGVSREMLANQLGMSETDLSNSIKKAQEEMGIDNIADMKSDGDIVVSGDETTLNVVTSGYTRIRTVDELLEAADVNREIWKVTTFAVNQYEMTMKSPVGTPIIIPLYQVKATLGRRKKDAFPTVQPISIDVTLNKSTEKAKPKKKSKKSEIKTKKALVMGDTHFGFVHEGMELQPFHDRLALDVVAQIIEMEDFDRVGVVGDLLDLTEHTSKFPRKPAFYWTTQPALVETAWWISYLSITDIVEGNHDERIEKFIVQNAISSYGLKAVDDLDKPPVMTIPYLLGLESRGVNYASGYPDSEVWLNDHIRLVHGNIARGIHGGTAGAVSKSSDAHTIFGHIHRTESATRSVHVRDGMREVCAICPGCMCRVDGIVPGYKRKQQWQQGLLVLEYTDDGDIFNYSQVRIQNGQAVYNGQILKGRDQFPRIKKDTNWSW